MSIWSEGSIIECDGAGVVRRYLHDGAEISAAASPGLPLTVAVSPGSLEAYLDFLGRLRGGQPLFGWPMQVQWYGRSRTLHFAGTPMPTGSLLVFASPSEAGLDSLCADLVRVNAMRCSHALPPAAESIASPAGACQARAPLRHRRWLPLPRLLPMRLAHPV